MLLRSFVVIGFLSCSPAQQVGDCGPKNCTGCCDALGVCKGGIAKDACGSGGFTCLACGVSQRCNAQSACELDPNAPQGGGSAGGSGGGVSQGGGASTPQDEYVRAHNTARHRAMPVPNPAIPDVTWDDTVAAFAKVGADRCIFSHRQQSQYGENLHAASFEDTPTAVIESFESEKQYYTYSTNGCTATCGHYTQVVWRSSVRIGCATTRCTVNSPFGNGPWYLTACNYDPPGNFVGMRPY